MNAPIWLESLVAEEVERQKSMIVKELADALMSDGEAGVDLRMEMTVTVDLSVG